MHASVVVVLALVAAAAAQTYQVVPIYNYQHLRDDSGQYSYSFSDGLGARHTDRGVLQNGPEGLVLVRSGSYAYTSPDGTPIELSYTADHTGYHPTARHLPVSPAAPAI